MIYAVQVYKIPYFGLKINTYLGLKGVHNKSKHTALILSERYYGHALQR